MQRVLPTVDSRQLMSWVDELLIKKGHGDATFDMKVLSSDEYFTVYERLFPCSTPQYVRLAMRSREVHITKNPQLRDWEDVGNIAEENIDTGRFRIVGIDGRYTPDPDYWFARWAVLFSYSDEEAVDLWYKEFPSWARPEERKHVKIHATLTKQVYNLDSWINEQFGKKCLTCRKRVDSKLGAQCLSCMSQ